MATKRQSDMGTLLYEFIKGVSPDELDNIVRARRKLQLVPGRHAEVLLELACIEACCTPALTLDWWKGVKS